MRVLIVEDNPDHCFILKKRLENHYKNIVIHTSSALDGAIELLSKYSYRAILLDYRLRGSSGIDLVRWMRSRGIDTPVIMITGFEDVEIAVQAIKLGVYDYLCKNEESLEKLPFLLKKASEEYRLRKKLSEAEFKYHALVEGMAEAVFFMNLKGKMVFISSSIRKLFNLSEQEFRESFKSLFPEDQWEKFMGKFREVISGKPVESFIVELMRLDGNRMNVEITASRYLENGVVKGVIGTLRDVTERVRLEREIRSEREKVIDIFNSMIDWIYITGCDHTIAFMNRSLIEELGSPDGKKCYEHIYGLSQPCGFCKLGEVMRGNTIRWEIRRRDGRTFDVISSPLLNPDGSRAKLEILRDITGRKRAEEDYRRQVEETSRVNEELKKVNEELRVTIGRLKDTQQRLVQSEKLAALAHFVSGIAHELNNPIFSAMGYAELLMLDRSDDLQLKNSLEKILSSLDRAGEIVNQLVQFAQYQRMEKTELAINEIIHSAVSMREHDLRVSGIDVFCELQDGLPPVMGSFLHIEQVLMNIIMNAEEAIRGAGRGGQIRIRSFFRPSPSAVVVEIANDGPEIPREVIKDIFNPFFTTKDVGKGRGLGLSTSYGIIREHGGEIIAESMDGWTSFIITFPVAGEGLYSRHDKKSEIYRKQE
jgi:PAS domain S-box-containing protein